MPLGKPLNNIDAYKAGDVVAAYAHDSALQQSEITVLQLLRDRLAGMNMLDLGVGGGRTTFHFAKLVKRYLGIDYSAAMIAACHERFANVPGHVAFEVGDARALTQLADDTFDFVFFSFNGLDNISHEDRLQALKEIHRVAKRGGCFCFSTHNLQSHAKLFGLKQQFALNPRRPAQNLVSWFELNYRYNPRLDRDSLLHAPYAVINDGAHEYRLQTYYIRPLEQIGQLQEHFGKVRVFAASGAEISGELALQANQDRWLYFLCEAK